MRSSESLVDVFALKFRGCCGLQGLITEMSKLKVD